MTRTIVMSPQAARDLDTIWNSIAEHSLDAADKFRDEVRLRVYDLTQNPQVGHEHREVRNRDLLCVNIRKYIVFYRFDEASVCIVRIVHGARDLRRLL